MVIGLRDAMKEILVDWPDDLEPAWRDALAGTALDFDAIGDDLVLEAWEPVFPTRRGRRFPGAPDGAHMLRAFDGIVPERVACVILGQDPYPSPSFATGRAFEAGYTARWREFEKMFSCSMRTLLQSIVVARTGDASYGTSIREWDRLIVDIEAGRVRLPAPSEIADHWVQQGVLLLNASFTLSRFAVAGDPHQLRGHLPLWRPLILEVIRLLAKPPARPVVFIGFGAPAAEILRSAGLIDAGAEEAERPGPVACLLREHPARGDALLARHNPFIACNRLLARFGAEPIAW